MFHKEDMEAYKNIKAPRELKEKVLSANTNIKTFPYRQLYHAVASFAMIVSFRHFQFNFISFGIISTAW